MTAVISVVCWLHFQLMHSWRIGPTAVVALMLDSQGDLWLRLRSRRLVRHQCLRGSCITGGLACIFYLNERTGCGRWLLLSMAALSPLQRSHLIWKIRFSLSDISIG